MHYCWIFRQYSTQTTLDREGNNHIRPNRSKETLNWMAVLDIWEPIQKGFLENLQYPFSKMRFTSDYGFNLVPKSFPQFSRNKLPNKISHVQTQQNLKKNKPRRIRPHMDRPNILGKKNHRIAQHNMVGSPTILFNPTI